MLAPPASGARYSDHEVSFMLEYNRKNIGPDASDPIIKACADAAREGNADAVASIFLYLRGRDLVFSTADTVIGSIQSGGPGATADGSPYTYEARAREIERLQILNSMQRGHLYCRRLLQKQNPSQ